METLSPLAQEAEELLSLQEFVALLQLEDPAELAEGAPAPVGPLHGAPPTPPLHALTRRPMPCLSPWSRPAQA
jgi:hypothetical protein